MSYQQLNEEHISMVSWVPPKSDGWKKILRSVTIFQLLQAEPSPVVKDKSLVIEGRGFGNVELVAHVVSVEKTLTSSVQYILEDGTGRIRADKDLDVPLVAEAEKEEIARCRALEHTYVEVLGVPSRKDDRFPTKISIQHIRPVHGYYQVMYHILNVIYINMLIQQHIEPYDFDRDPEPNHDGDVPMDDDQVFQDDTSAAQDHIAYATLASPAILPSTFSPRKHRPYAGLRPLEGAIIKYMCHHSQPVLITEMARTIQSLCRCTELQFIVAVQALLSEAYITSPLDDGYVIITPRH